MKHIPKLNPLKFAIKRSRYMKVFQFRRIFVTTISDVNFFGDQSIFFPLYLYPDESEGAVPELPLRAKSKTKRTLNLSSEFLNAIKEPLGSEPTPDEILFYIYAVLYSPIYRKQYEEFLKINFLRVPLPPVFTGETNNAIFPHLPFAKGGDGFSISFLFKTYE